MIPAVYIYRVLLQLHSAGLVFHNVVVLQIVVLSSVEQISLHHVAHALVKDWHSSYQS